jgi:hypothetical protein
VTLFELIEDGAGDAGVVGVEGELLPIVFDGR